MKSKLDSIVDLRERAHRTNYRVEPWAKSCGVTERQLRRYVEAKFKSSPHELLLRWRLESAPRALARGEPVKVVAAELGFDRPDHFARAFRACFGYEPHPCGQHTEA